MNKPATQEIRPKRQTASETISEIAGVLKDNPGATRAEVAKALNRSYGYVCKRWAAACEAAGVENVNLNERQKGKSKGGADLMGRRFGHLVVVENLGTNEHGARMWRCECDCGAEAVRSTYALTSGQSVQCAKWDHDILGKTFGALTVLDYAGEYDHGDALYRCRCECGRETVTAGYMLKRGRARSCGCRTGNPDYVDGTKLSGLDADLRSDSPSGVTGVVPSRGSWKAEIRLSGTVYYLGEYRSFERAVAVRREAEELLFDPMLKKHGLAPTDEQAWRGQVAEAIRAMKERHREAEKAEGDKGEQEEH